MKLSYEIIYSPYKYYIIIFFIECRKYNILVVYNNICPPPTPAPPKMLFITKIKSSTDRNKTIYSVVYNSVRKIIQSMDEVKIYDGIENDYYQYMVDVNNMLKNLLDVNTLCTHNLIYIVNKLWVIINRIGTEIRLLQGSKPELMKYNLLFTNLQNEYFTVFMELNSLINHEIKNLEKSKYKENDIISAIGGIVAPVTFPPPHAAWAEGGDDDEEIKQICEMDEIFLDDEPTAGPEPPEPPAILGQKPRSEVPAHPNNMFLHSPKHCGGARKRITPIQTPAPSPPPSPNSHHHHRRAQRRPCLKATGANYNFETIDETPRTPVDTKSCGGENKSKFCILM
jgi:hypothetical protein